MTMAAKGAAKLIEECGELLQELGKRLAYYTTDEHPDGKGPLNERIQDEMGDVIAAIQFHAETWPLDQDAIVERAYRKLNLFRMWEADEHNNTEGIDATP